MIARARRRSFLLALLLGVLALPAAAQGPGPTPFPFGGTSLRVSVLTFGQGNAVFEQFGHNALRITDLVTGVDLAYNWGMFSFDDPNFLGRFLSGDTRYWVEPYPASFLIEAYIAQDREVTEQVLALTEAQRETLALFVMKNALPENKYYRYDYFLDNCSTRLRDALDAALGGSLQRRFSVLTTEWTYRSESVRLTHASGLAQAGIDIALGPRADRPITAWEAMFIPMRLRDYLREVTVPGLDGTPVPLVVSDEVIYQAKRAAELPARKGLALGAWGPILGVWMLLLTPLALASRARTRVPAAIMAALWYGVTGLVGVVLLGMWIGSAHVFWYGNLNLLLLSPLGLVAALPVARGILRGVLSPLARALLLLILAQVAVVPLLALVGPQVLGGPLLLLLPAHLGLAVACWRHLRVANAAGVMPVTADAPRAAEAR